MKQRCNWVGEDPLSIAYHDSEWGVPVYDDGRLFEFLILEGMQAGLSWMTILRKRENFRKALAGFDAARIARFSDKRIEKLMLDAGIIRNRLKLNACITNARCFLDVQREFGSFSDYIWQFTGGVPVTNKWSDTSQIPAETEEARCFSKDLKKRGFKFVGPTIVYAYMQAVGMVNDHLTGCFRYDQVKACASNGGG